MCKDVYCKKCVLKSNNPGIVIQSNGMCNICNGDERGKFFNNYKMSSDLYNKFKQDVLKNKEDRNYDCLVMFSGGKDSINILERMVNEEKLRVLAVTVDLPFESKSARDHIEFVTNKLDITHMTIKPSKQNYIEMMRTVFLQSYEGETLNMEKISKFKQLSPCIVCTCFITIMSCFVAQHFYIPYVIYCADPGQIANLPVGIENVLNTFKSMFKDEFINKICSDNIDYLDLQNNKQVPTIVYPYIAVPDYNIDKIIRRLKSLDLYKTTPQEGHCVLWSLLNYNSIKRYDGPFYVLDYASDVRTMKASRAETIQFIELFDKLLLKVGEKGLTKEDDLLLKTILKRVFKTEGEFNYVYKNIYDLPDICKELNINLRDIK